MTKNDRIKNLLECWNSERRAFSRIDADDTEFFKKIGISSFEIGTTSLTGGSQIIYYDTACYDSEDAATKRHLNLHGISLLLEQTELKHLKWLVNKHKKNTPENDPSYADLLGWEEVIRSLEIKHSANNRKLFYYTWGNEPKEHVTVWTVNEEEDVVGLGFWPKDELPKGAIYDCPAR